ncbi:MAG: hypothetical protein NTX53_08285 [candidate division WOR-3 bacterium]|nr:hypothetical protein [candidate division WOR-3 bacterium]
MIGNGKQFHTCHGEKRGEQHKQRRTVPERDQPRQHLKGPDEEDQRQTRIAETEKYQEAAHTQYLAD